MSHSARNKLVIAVLALFVAVAAFGVWYKFYRDAAQPAWIDADGRDRFIYGSAGAEVTAGIPYWIWLALPRIFPEYMPGPGGYSSLGFSWEETREMPVGFSKKTVGYVRVAGNCAMCHSYSRDNGPDQAPTVFAAGTGHTAEFQKLLTFYRQCAEDPRFNAANLLDEISMATRLSLIDRLIYRFILIPRTRERLLQADSVVMNSELLRHSRDPRSTPAFRQQLQNLAAALNGAEKDALLQYLKTLP